MKRWFDSERSKTLKHINNFLVEKIEQSGCNNGNYPAWTGKDDNGNVITGRVCNCFRGCSNTDEIVEIDGEYYLCENEQ
jgi:hypothetical protein